MVVTLPWLAVGSFASGVGSLYLLAQLREHWEEPGAKWFVATIATITLWCGSYGVALLTDQPPLRLALEAVSWACLAWIGFFFVSFALGYTGRTAILESLAFRSLAVFPLATTLLAATNSVHGLLWMDYRQVSAFGVVGAEYTLLPIGTIAILVAMLFVSFGTVLLFDTVVSYGPLYRREAIAVGLSPLPPGIAVLAWAGSPGSVAAVNLTTLMFLPHIALDSYAFIRSDMFEFNPATRRAGERAAIDDIATPVAILDVDYRVVNLNPAAEAMLAVDKRDALTRPLNDLLVGDSVAVGDEDDDRVAVENTGRRQEFKSQRTELRDGAGSHLGYTVVFQDITDEIRRERRLEVLNRFLRHNVRNESVVIQARADFLADELTGEHADHAATIERAVDRLVESGEKARTLSEASTADADLETVELADLVAEDVDALRAEYDGEVSVTLPPSLQIRTQPALLSVLVTNLVENALQHTDGPVAVDAAADGDDVVLTISDEGPGVPEHELAVLDRGRETDLEHGTGIGLWLVSWAVTSLGGEIAFDTSDGTTATVRLPADPTAVEAPTA